MKNSVSKILLHLLALLLALPAMAWELSGVKTVSAQTREQQLIPLGTVEFKPLPNGRSRLQLSMAPSRAGVPRALPLSTTRCGEA